LGQPAYDLVSLLQDARRDVSLEAEAAMIVRFQEAAGVNAQEFSSSYAVLGAQRALRILGIFARLCLVGGKPGYVGLMPRVWRQLQINLQNPVLAPLERLCADLLPQPSAANLALIGDKCARFR
jgi:aminoglycoside/choline kinase family phosphotransferase